MQLEQNAYIRLINIFGVPRNNSKDVKGCIVDVFEIEIDTTSFTARLPEVKLHKAITLTAHILSYELVSLMDMQSLVGFLSFCAKAVQLGRVFMRRLWDFVVYHFEKFPTKSTRKQISSWVRDDLLWWNCLFPQFNDVLFFDGEQHQKIQIFTNASSYGLGDFFFVNSQSSWEDEIISQENAFILIIQQPPPAVSWTNQKSTNLSCELPRPNLDINIHEVEAILLAFQTYRHQWTRCCAIIHTDSSTAKSGIDKSTLKDPANYPLRQLLLSAAQ